MKTDSFNLEEGYGQLCVFTNASMKTDSFNLEEVYVPATRQSVMCSRLSDTWMGQRSSLLINCSLRDIHVER